LLVLLSRFVRGLRFWSKWPGNSLAGYVIENFYPVLFSMMPDGIQ
jgi:hypothetical protein